MIRRSQYRCSFKIVGSHIPIDSSLERCKECFAKLIDEGLVANASFYRYENMGFLYVEEIVADTTAEALDVDKIMADLNPYLKPWPEEDGDAYFAPMRMTLICGSMREPQRRRHVWDVLHLFFRISFLRT